MSTLFAEPPPQALMCALFVVLAVLVVAVVVAALVAVMAGAAPQDADELDSQLATALHEAHREGRSPHPPFRTPPPRNP